MQERMLKVSPAAAAVLAALVAVGCGSTTKPASTIAQFAEQANEICAGLTQQQRAIEARTRAIAQTGQGTSQAFARQWRETATVSRVADTKFGALPRPPAEADTIEQLAAGYFQEANDEDAIANAYASRDAAAVETSERAFLGRARRDAAVASSLGMTDCAKAES
jgi:hypothetical protein